MLFAVPLALVRSRCTSATSPRPAFRRTIKPVVEIMATVPSVVIGFLIALWLAPIVERWILALFVSLIAVPATFVAVHGPLATRCGDSIGLDEWRTATSSWWFCRCCSSGVGVAVYLAMPLGAWLFGGHFRRWLFEGPLGMQYDQRNSIIIAFGLGFTVIPIIFSIAEDSLSNVPYNMTAASMAVGASRWQTLWRVVLPSASPGIFAAMMIGFGRAVGETMIVLMATGNTPIMDWSPFNGMRTLSANIAVEIPEAPVGGTLYRVLFLCAVLSVSIDVHGEHSRGTGSPASAKTVRPVLTHVSAAKRFWRRGEPLVWATAAALAGVLLLVVLLLAVVLVNGLGVFWPAPRRARLRWPTAENSWAGSFAAK